MIDLGSYCSKGSSRSYLHQPFSVGAYSYATDGHIAIRLPRREDVAEIDTPPDIAKIFAPSDDLSFFQLPDIDIPSATPPQCKDCGGVGYMARCAFCKGEGHHDCDCEFCDRGCDECDGTGEMPSNSEDDFPRTLCEMCDGCGRQKDNRSVVFPDGMAIGARFISLLLSTPGPHEMADQDRAEGEMSAHFFRFNGGMLAIMPKRRSKHDDDEIFVASANETMTAPTATETTRTA